LLRQRLQREMHNLLRELRKLREETGNEEEEVEMLPRDTGLRPARTQQEVCEERSCKSEPTEHGPEARVTGERHVEATEDAIRKSEPTAKPNSLPAQENERMDLCPAARLNADPSGIQSADPN